MHVYRCTPPGFNIIYKNNDDYDEAEAAGDFELIQSALLQLMLQRVPQAEPHEVVSWFSVHYVHPDMYGYNAYGYARED